MLRVLVAQSLDLLWRDTFAIVPSNQDRSHRVIPADRRPAKSVILRVHTPEKPCYLMVFVDVYNSAIFPSWVWRNLLDSNRNMLKSRPKYGIIDLIFLQMLPWNTAIYHTNLTASHPPAKRWLGTNHMRMRLCDFPTGTSSSSDDVGLSATKTGLKSSDIQPEGGAFIHMHLPSLGTLPFQSRTAEIWIPNKIPNLLRAFFRILKCRYDTETRMLLLPKASPLPLMVSFNYIPHACTGCGSTLP